MYANEQKAAPRPRLTVPGLRKMKAEGRRIVSVTAYDAGFARTVDSAGIDFVLVGDSLGMVCQGHDSTLPVTVADIAYHTTAVARVLQRALLVADLPFGADATPERALDASLQLLQAGAEMVKIEGAGFKVDIIRYLVEREIPVCSHLGLTPQSVLRLGGFKIQGRGDAARQLVDDAKAVAEAGASIMVLECVPTPVAAAVTAAVPVPTIGIGAGPQCDGQVLVLHDMLGLSITGRVPKFVKNFMLGQDNIQAALKAYVSEVKATTFPGIEHGFSA